MQAGASSRAPRIHAQVLQAVRPTTAKPSGHLGKAGEMAAKRTPRFTIWCLIVGLAIISGALGATSAQAGYDWIDRVNALSADWLGTDVVAPEILPSTGHFEPDDGAGLDPAHYISWNFASPDGGSYTAIVLLVDAPIASVFRLEGRELVGRSWTLASRDANSASVMNSSDIATTQPNTLACAIGTSAAAGAVGSRACAPVGGTGAIVCGTLSSIAGGIIGFFVCQDPDDESIRVSRAECRVTYCDVEVET